MQNKRKLSIGEVAKLTGVTIRTLQYYDNIGLVPLQKEHTNGRRYFRDSDLAKLQQVLFYKSLGLSIKDIRKLVVEADTTEQIAQVLDRQLEVCYQKLNVLKMNISLIEVSLSSLKENQSLPLGQLVQLIISLNKDTVYRYKDVSFEKNTEKIFMKYCDDYQVLLEIYWDWKSLVLEAVSHILNDIDPESNKGQQFAKKWVGMIARITNGNQELLKAYKNSYENREQWPEEDRRLMEFADPFIDQAIQIYLSGADNTDQE